MIAPVIGLPWSAAAQEGPVSVAPSPEEDEGPVSLLRTLFPGTEDRASAMRRAEFGRAGKTSAEDLAAIELEIPPPPAADFAFSVKVVGNPALQAQLDGPVLPPALLRPYVPGLGPSFVPLSGPARAGSASQPGLVGPPVPSADGGALGTLGTQAAQSGRAQSGFGTTAEAPNGELPDQGTGIRVNRAVARDFMVVLNLDGRRARNIIQYRTIHGTFDGPEELAQVAGITDALIIQWEDRGLLDFH